jgi:hypothetical protein
MAGTRFGSGKIGTEAGGAHPSKTANLGLSLNGGSAKEATNPRRRVGQPVSTMFARLRLYQTRVRAQEKILWIGSQPVGDCVA